MIFLRKKVPQLHEVYTNLVEIIWYMKIGQQLHEVYVNTCHMYEVNNNTVATLQSGLTDLKLS